MNSVYGGKTSSDKDIALHRTHDFPEEAIRKNVANKTIILYRKDPVSQLDAYLRYMMGKDWNSPQTNCLNYHSGFHGKSLSYSDNVGLIQAMFQYYINWKKKWVDTPTPNSILVEYDSFMRSPKETIEQISIFLGIPVNSSKVVDDLKIEYKHTISSEKYNELKEILAKAPTKKPGFSFRNGRMNLQISRYFE